MNVVFAIGKWNNPNRARARHIPDDKGRPICWKPGKFKNVFSWQSEDGDPTCAVCIQKAQRAADRELYIERIHRLQEADKAVKS